MAIAHLERHPQRLVARRRHDRAARLRRALDRHEPVRADVQHRARHQHAPRRQRQRQRPPRARHHPPPPPPPLLRGQHERVPLPPRQLRIRDAIRQRGDHDNLRATHQNKKYRWAIGRTRAGSHVITAAVRRAPRYVSGSTSIRGSASLWIMSRLLSPATATDRDRPPGEPEPLRHSVGERGRRDERQRRRADARGRAPRTSAGRAPAAASGSTRSGRPSPPTAMRPPLTTSSGLTPKNAGFQSTRSASLPTSTEPTWLGDAVRDRRVDRVLRDVALHAQVVVARRSRPAARPR